MIVLLSGIALASQCNDDLDNDLDGDIDFPQDSGCSNANDNGESLVLGYAHGCLTDGQRLMNVFGEITYECEHTTCNVCVMLAESGNYTTLPSHCNNLPQCGFGQSGGGQIDLEAPILQIFSPTQSGVYSTRSILLNLQSNENADIYYLDNINGRGRWTKVCTNCDFYSARRTFKEGLNDLTFRATDSHGNQNLYEWEFYLDSVKPKIKNTEPTEGFASGVFNVEFEEENPSALVLHYGNSATGFRTYDLDIDEDCVQDRTFVCETQVDLTSYNNQDISYYFVLRDIADNVVQSRAAALRVDNSAPIINSLEFTTEGKYANFVIDLTEQNFKKVTYIDYSDSRPKETVLCNRLVNNICEKRVSFKDGGHDVEIKAYDLAGSAATGNAEFFTDSKKPKIKETSPKSGFYTGEFEVKFSEENPVDLKLYYGNGISGMYMLPLNLEDCSPIGNDLSCSINVDLSDYDGERINYKFELGDRANQYVMSKETKLDVDVTYPVINDITYTLSGNKANVLNDLTEQNLDEAIYINYNDNNPQEKVFCTRLPCRKTIALNAGDNNIDFRVVDKAGNSVAESRNIVL